MALLEMSQANAEDWYQRKSDAGILRNKIKPIQNQLFTMGLAFCCIGQKTLPCEY